MILANLAGLRPWRIIFHYSVHVSRKSVAEEGRGETNSSPCKLDDKAFANAIACTGDQDICTRSVVLFLEDPRTVKDVAVKQARNVEEQGQELDDKVEQEVGDSDDQQEEGQHIHRLLLLD
jgi:hypothetical protein